MKAKELSEVVPVRQALVGLLDLLFIPESANHVCQSQLASSRCNKVIRTEGHRGAQRVQSGAGAGEDLY